MGAVNWWATWPADPVNGYVATERALFQLEKGGAFERETRTAEVFNRLRPLAAAASDKPRGTMSRWPRCGRCAGPAPPDVEAVVPARPRHRHHAATGRERGADLAGLDTRLDAVRGNDRFVDGLIGEAGDGMAPGDVLVLVGDPGRMARRSGAAEGVFALRGGPVARATWAPSPSATSRPTSCISPGSRQPELEGRVLETVLTPLFRRRPSGADGGLVRPGAGPAGGERVAPRHARGAEGPRLLR